ncbi:MAG: methyltransferase [Pseudanabaenales cyanobacterium]|nr:methyltransferase [Pseudanabaenales cyanobacterium]
MHYQIDKESQLALLMLADLLSRSGYKEFYASFNPLTTNTQKWVLQRKNVPDALGTLIDLFLLGKPVYFDSAKFILGELVAPLCRMGVLACLSNEKYISTSDLILVPVMGLWLFCQKPQPNPTLYFGEDSISLLLRLQPKRDGRCLDLCAGPGIQALYCSLFAREVIAVELNPVAVALAKVNVAINDCSQKIRVYCGSLYEPLDMQSFDTIVANPPLLPFPENVPYPFVGHGGKDGLKITRKILEGLPQFLASSGTAQLIGTTLSDGIQPLCIDLLKAWSYTSMMDVLMTITAHRILSPGSFFFNGLVNTAVQSSINADEEAIIKAYQKSLANQGATHLCAYFLHITRGSGAFFLQDLALEDDVGLWYI